MMIRKRFQPFLRQQRCLVAASQHVNDLSLDSIQHLTGNRAIPTSTVRLKGQAPSSSSVTFLSARHYSTTAVFQGSAASKHGDDDYLKSVYCVRAERAGLKKDPIQLRTLQSLDRLRRELKQVKPPTQILDVNPKPQQSASNSSSWSSWFGESANKEATKNTSNSTQKNAPMPPLPKGCYLHGGE